MNAQRQDSLAGKPINFNSMEATQGGIWEVWFDKCILEIKMHILFDMIPVCKQFQINKKILKNIKPTLRCKPIPAKCGMAPGKRTSSCWGVCVLLKSKIRSSQKVAEVGWKKFKSFFASNGVSVQLDAFSCQEKVLPLPFHRDTGKDAAEKCFQL